MNRPTTFRRFIALALLMSLGSAFLLFNQSTAPAVRASTMTDTANKVSPDLRQLIQSGNGSSQVRVIVQYNGSATSSSGGLLGLVGSLLQTVVGVVEA